jgi:hypothetical protein
MSKATHTTGPWRVDRSTTNDVTLTGGTIHIVMAQGVKTPCAFVSGYDDDSCAEGSANANLIAAAPDMYEAHVENTRLLSLLLRDLTGRVEATKLAAIETAISRSEAAIAKAEGRSND